jgi:hypothetical protein
LTAEIAILNKYAVALAADSAVTIGSDAEQLKIYDSADKLFELSRNNPIGIMVYSGAQLTKIPLSILIHEFRKTYKSVDNVEIAAKDFLNFLQCKGQESSEKTLNIELQQALLPIFKMMFEEYNKKVIDVITTGKFDPKTEFQEIRDEVLSNYDLFFEGRKQAEFVDRKQLRITAKRRREIHGIATSILNGFKDSDIEKAVVIAIKSLLTQHPIGPRIGIVIAGFGNSELFPTLISYNLSCMPFGKLKFERTEFVDIDRNGLPARVLPFAQKEMVDRFLFGLDSIIGRKIIKLLKTTIPEIRTQMLGKLVMSAEDKNSLLADAESAEKAFLQKLENAHFSELRSESKAEIESMVEFMPKPEMANMAEALVNLTSIKRRVSKGMETVGGPIDVAVISRTEGFVWVKRKHYFPPELNLRYSKRV